MLTWFLHVRVTSSFQRAFPPWTSTSSRADGLSTTMLAGADIAFTSFPGAHWKQVWSDNSQERLN